MALLVDEGKLRLLLHSELKHTISHTYRELLIERVIEECKKHENKA